MKRVNISIIVCCFLLECFSISAQQQYNILLLKGSKNEVLKKIRKENCQEKNTNIQVEPLIKSYKGYLVCDIMQTLTCKDVIIKETYISVAFHENNTDNFVFYMHIPPKHFINNSEMPARNYIPINIYQYYEMLKIKNICETFFCTNDSNAYVTYDDNKKIIKILTNHPQKSTTYIVKEFKKDFVSEFPESRSYLDYQITLGYRFQQGTVKDIYKYRELLFGNDKVTELLFMTNFRFVDKLPDNFLRMRNILDMYESSVLKFSGISNTVSPSIKINYYEIQ